MERRQFIALLAASLVPAPAAAAEGGGSRLAELKVQLRKQYGEKTDQVLHTVHEAIHEAAAENPDLDPADEDDVELLTEVALRKTVARLEADGVTLSSGLATEGEGS